MVSAHNFADGRSGSLAYSKTNQGGSIPTSPKMGDGKGVDEMREGRRESVGAAAMRMGRSEDEVRFRLLHDYEYAYDAGSGEMRVRRRRGAMPPRFAEFLRWLAK